MKKRLVSLLLVCSMILSLFTGLSVTALAANVDPATATPEPTAADAFGFNSSNGQITGYTGNDTFVVIPAAIDGKTVKSIGMSAFDASSMGDCIQVNTIVIPSTVTSLNSYAFDEQSNLHLYFYGEAPYPYSAFESMSGVTVHCKEEYKDDFSEAISDADYGDSGNEVVADITAGLTDLVYVVDPDTCTHNWTLTSTTTPATCAAEGKGEYTCTKCKTTKEDAIPKTTTHTWDEGKVTTEAACETAGVKTYTCSVCKETKTETIKALGHKWGDGAVTKQPTCTEAGEKQQTCSICQKMQTATVAATGHNFNTDGSCTNDGCDVVDKFYTFFLVFPRT